MRLHLPLITFTSLSFLGSAVAMPAMDTRVPVPVARLVANTAKYIKKHPKDAQGYYTMARVHSIAFAQSFLQPAPVVRIVRGAQATQEHIVGSPERSIKAMPTGETPNYSGKTLPDIGIYGDDYRNDTNAKPSSTDLYHLREGVRFYARATALAPQDEDYWLGYAWMIEQYAPYAARMGAVWTQSRSPKQRATSLDWSNKAIEIYRRIYNQELAKYKFDYHNGVLIETGEGILRLQAALPRPLTSPEAKEKQRIQDTLVRVNRIPMPISPIIVPLGKRCALPDLLTQNSRVRFDLSGDGLGRDWPWVDKETGILVWDPEREGRITSGRQLFGSVTWWVFWRNGYEALAALDNDANGKLTGSELEGIAIWRDANGNGVCEPGEVKPLSAWGIVALSTKATQQIQGMPANLQGATTSSGVVLPTYDWMPCSLN